MTNPARVVLNISKINFEKRQLIYDLIRRDFKLRYLGSFLGTYWNFIHPVAMIAIYAVIFAQVLQLRLGAGVNTSPWSYTLYLCAGLLPWNAFQEMVLRGSNQFYEHANFIKKIAFPKEILQSITTGSALLTLLISLLGYSFLLLISGHGFAASYLLLPYVLACQLLAASGLGLFCGVLNVFFRDIQQMLGILFPIWFWLTPIIYRFEQIPSLYQKFFWLNPFMPFIVSYQKILFAKSVPPTTILGLCLLLGLSFYTLGACTLYRFRDQIADEL